ncbi:MAG: endo-1,4-beta-xylanase [Bacteroidaceae bacterium]|nr:endo-1,4-beta-xylanase [Bacteroidaceae bacterium]
MRRTYILALAFAAAFSANAQQKFEQGIPNNSNYEYLNDYSALKDYVDLEKYPNFKLGIALSAPDYNQKGIVYKMANANFMEVVPGNAMKYGSCVKGDGSMDFTTVTKFVNEASAAGLTLYGHTLAWHSQQNGLFLNGLIKGKPAPAVEDGTKVWVDLVTKDYRTSQSVGWKASESDYGYSISFDATNGLKAHCTKKVNSWEVQYQALTDIPTEKGKTYKMTITVKGSAAGKLHTKLGDWNAGATKNISFSTSWQDIAVSYTAQTHGSFLLLQHGDFVGDIYIKSIKFAEQKSGKYITEDRRCLVIKAGEKKEENYDNQFWIVTGSFSAGAKFEFSADVRADKAATVSTQIHSTPGTYVHYEALGNIPFTNQWTTIKASGTFSKAGSSIAFNLNDLADANNYYFDNISLKINGTEKVKNGDLEGTDVSSFKQKLNRGSVTACTIAESISYLYVPGLIPLTAEEKHDTLVWAMERWIKGMMNACGGKVKAWDVVNEAISGGNADSQGVYALQHENGSGDFFWQDHMGDLEYVRQAVRLARKYGPEDVKLFINDYNLESDWDSNGKLKSLIKWIERWEADGVTHIDGIGTQMHISCYMNATTQQSKKKGIENMLKLMAKTGKLVRISELDMGMVDANGKDVPTANMTEEMHKRMADLYEWIIKKYFEIVPVDQQWGICQWCATDSPSNSGWRANTPVGLWTLDYYRKHTYAGYVRGLGGVPTYIPEVQEETAADGRIYDLQGRPINVSSKDMLPAGLYIINGRVTRHTPN